MFLLAYLKSSSTGGWESSSDWLIVSVCLSVFLALLLLWVLFYKLYWVSIPPLLKYTKYNIPNTKTQPGYHN